MPVDVPRPCRDTERALVRRCIACKYSFCSVIVHLVLTCTFLSLILTFGRKLLRLCGNAALRRRVRVLCILLPALQLLQVVAAAVTVIRRRPHKCARAACINMAARSVQQQRAQLRVCRAAVRMHTCINLVCLAACRICHAAQLHVIGNACVLLTWSKLAALRGACICRWVHEAGDFIALLLVAALIIATSLLLTIWPLRSASHALHHLAKLDAEGLPIDSESAALAPLVDTADKAALLHAPVSSGASSLASSAEANAAPPPLVQVKSEDAVPTPALSLPPPRQHRQSLAQLDGPSGRQIVHPAARAHRTPEAVLAAHPGPTTHNPAAGWQRQQKRSTSASSAAHHATSSGSHQKQSTMASIPAASAVPAHQQQRAPGFGHDATMSANPAFGRHSGTASSEHRTGASMTQSGRRGALQSRRSSQQSAHEYAQQSHMYSAPYPDQEL